MFAMASQKIKKRSRKQAKYVFCFHKPNFVASLKSTSKRSRQKNIGKHFNIILDKILLSTKFTSFNQTHYISISPPFLELSTSLSNYHSFYFCHFCNFLLHLTLESNILSIFRFYIPY